MILISLLIICSISFASAYLVVHKIDTMDEEIIFPEELSLKDFNGDVEILSCLDTEILIKNEEGFWDL